jgi:hypothetical protein
LRELVELAAALYLMAWCAGRRRSAPSGLSSRARWEAAVCCGNVVIGAPRCEDRLTPAWPGLVPRSSSGSRIPHRADWVIAQVRDVHRPDSGRDIMGGALQPVGEWGALAVAGPTRRPGDGERGTSGCRVAPLGLPGRVEPGLRGVLGAQPPVVDGDHRPAPAGPRPVLALPVSAGLALHRADGGLVVAGHASTAGSVRTAPGVWGSVQAVGEECRWSRRSRSRVAAISLCNPASAAAICPGRRAGPVPARGLWRARPAAR